MELSILEQKPSISELVAKFNHKVSSNEKFLEKQNERATDIVFYDDDINDFHSFVYPKPGFAIISENLCELIKNCTKHGSIKQLTRKSAKKILQSQAILEKYKNDSEELLVIMIQLYLEKYEYFLEFFHLDEHEKIKENFEVLLSSIQDDPGEILGEKSIIQEIEKKVNSSGTYKSKKDIKNENLENQKSLRKMITDMKNAGKFTVKEICEKCKITLSKYYEILKKIRRGIAFEDVQINKKIVKSYLKSEELALFKRMADDPAACYTAKEMKDRLYEIFGTEISVGNVYYHLHNTFGYSYKRNRHKPPSAFSEEQKILDFNVAKYWLNFIDKEKEVICIDETSVCLGTKTEYSFSKRGSQPYRIGYSKSEAYNLTMAISSNKIYCYQIRQDTNNEITFIEFIIKLATKILSGEPQQKSNVVIFLDNAKFHKSNLVLDLINLLPLKFCFSSPNNSNLNPIENVFGLIKRQLKSMKNITRHFFIFSIYSIDPIF